MCVRTEKQNRTKQKLTIVKKKEIFGKATGKGLSRSPENLIPGVKKSPKPLLAHQKQLADSDPLSPVTGGPEINNFVFLYFSQVECNTIQE